jgi:hypothetical protein
MPTIIRWNCLLLTVVILMLARGTGVSARQEKASIEADLKLLVLAYNLHNLDTKMGPTKAEDLAPYFDPENRNQRLLPALKSGQIQFQYNVSIAYIVKTTGPAKTILAYEKDLPTKGGYAAFADGTVRKMTPEEFKKTLLAGMK